MQKENRTLITPEGQKLTFRESKSVEVTLNISTDTMEMLREIAKEKDLSVESVLKFFISKGLREMKPEESARRAIERFRSRKAEKTKKEVDLAA